MKNLYLEVEMQHEFPMAWDLEQAPSRLLISPVRCFYRLSAVVRTLGLALYGQLKVSSVSLWLLMSEYAL